MDFEAIGGQVVDVPARGFRRGGGGGLTSGVSPAAKAALIAEKCPFHQSAAAYRLRAGGVGSARCNRALKAPGQGNAKMAQFNETELTAAVIRSFDQTPDPRAKFLLQELVTSLHDYVRKTNLTFEEWDHAIGFLTRTGQKCTDIRQEFILLSDVLGVSDAGGCGQPPGSRRRHRDHRARAVLCRRAQGDAARHRHLGEPARRAHVRAEPRHRPQRPAAGQCAGRCLARGR